MRIQTTLEKVYTMAQTRHVLVYYYLYHMQTSLCLLCIIFSLTCVTFRCGEDTHIVLNRCYGHLLHQRNHHRRRHHQKTVVQHLKKPRTMEISIINASAIKVSVLNHVTVESNAQTTVIINLTLCFIT